MNNVELILILLGTILVTGAIGKYTKLPSTILFLLTGLIISLVAHTALIELNPHFFFLLVLPPLLFDAAQSISFDELKMWRLQIITLAVGLVLFTAGVVAYFAHRFIPGISWPLGWLIGALISPPDAIAATSSTKGLKLSPRIITIIEGESLINDASALIIYQYALDMVNTNHFAIGWAGFSFLKISILSVVIGFGFGIINHKILVKAKDATLATILSLVVPLFAYSISEHFHLSGVLTVVTCGLYTAYYSFELNAAHIKLRIKEFWEVLVFLLNAGVFLVLGLQLPELTHQFSMLELQHLIAAGFFLSLVVILARMIWIFPLSTLRVWLSNQCGNFSDNLNKKFFAEVFIVAWSGMRGAVSLAAALAIPLMISSNIEFPMRNQILLITFVVILFTLIIQSITLPFFIKKLKLDQSEEII